MPAPANKQRLNSELLRSCKGACILSVSNEHVTILLFQDGPQLSENNNLPDGDSTSVQSIVKFTVVPKHKDQLPNSRPTTGMLVEDLIKQQDTINADESRQILQFCQSLDYMLTSESGAEYSYYAAKEKHIGMNPWSLLSRLFSNDSNDNKASFMVELISPASIRQIQRSMPPPAMALVQETPAHFQSIIRPHIRSVVASGSLSWIENVVQGKKEVERLLLDQPEYILNVDTKWRSHPDPLKVPREQWHQHPSVADLYCLAIVKNGENLTCLRDLRANHIHMLQSILIKGIDVIEQVYGVAKDQLRVFVHYQPQFYHFHVHFTRLENELGCQVERAHLLTDIVQNLQADSEFYVKRTLTYKLSVTDPLFASFQKFTSHRSSTNI